MVVLGITGGVGSGKSKILNELKDNYNAYIVEADKLAHELMMPKNPIYNSIVEAFGNEIVEDKPPYYIDRQRLGNIVFNNTEKLELLNSITHPIVKEQILKLIEIQKNQKTDLFVIEAAILIEAGYKEICDVIWYIWVDKKERVKRLMESRGYTEEKCISIFQSQQTDEFYKSNSDAIIDNSGDFDNTLRQLKDLLNIL